jgi:tetratricopeptide (TPR) repeat protein
MNLHSHQRITLALLILVSHGLTQEQRGSLTASEPLVTADEQRLLASVSGRFKTDPKAAIARLRQACTEASSPALDFALGAFLFKEEQYAAAEEALSGAVRKLPRFARAWAMIGRVRLMVNKPQGAAAAFKEALVNGPPSVDTWKLLGYCHLLADRPLAAEAAYKQALGLDPEDSDVLLGLAKAFLLGERYTEALLPLRQLSRKDARVSEYWTLQANAYMGAGNHDRALVVLETAKRLGVLGPQAVMTLGDLYYNKGLFDQAIARYDDALQSGALTPGRLFSCAEALFHAGKIDAAATYLAKAEAGKPANRARGRILAGAIAEARDDFDAACKAYEDAIEADPLNGEALLALGKLKWRRQEYDRAEIVLDRCARIPGREAEAKVLLAQIAVERDDYEKAIAHLEKAVEIKPSARIEEYLQRVRRTRRLGGSADSEATVGRTGDAGIDGKAD